MCGHVLAWGNKSKTAYIAPMEVLFEDIKNTLGAERVCLPGASDAIEAEDSNSAKRAAMQMDASREVELALGDMKLGREPTLNEGSQKKPRPKREKDIPNSYQLAAQRLESTHSRASVVGVENTRVAG